MKTSTAVFACVALLSSAAAKLVDLPTNVTLIHPIGKVNKSEKVSFGFADTSLKDVFGVSYTITSSYTYPNGTSGLGPGNSMRDGECFNSSTVGGGAEDAFLADVIGSCVSYIHSTHYALSLHGLPLILSCRCRYTISWNYTYTTSADPSQANATFCGPGPFSHQKFLLNTTFEVVDQGASTTTGRNTTAQTVTSRLPTAPTGKVNSPDAKSGASSSFSLFTTVGKMGMLVSGATALVVLGSV
jgi:hypothetical protein